MSAAEGNPQGVRELARDVLDTFVEMDAIPAPSPQEFEGDAYAEFMFGVIDRLTAIDLPDIARRAQVYIPLYETWTIPNLAREHVNLAPWDFLAPWASDTMVNGRHDSTQCGTASLQKSWKGAHCRCIQSIPAKATVCSPVRIIPCSASVST